MESSWLGAPMGARNGPHGVAGSTGLGSREGGATGHSTCQAACALQTRARTVSEPMPLQGAAEIYSFLRNQTTPPSFITHHSSPASPKYPP